MICQGLSGSINELHHVPEMLAYATTKPTPPTPGLAARRTDPATSSRNRQSPRVDRASDDFSPASPGPGGQDRQSEAAYDPGVRVGVLMLPTDPWPESVQRAQRLESIGYHHLWTYDHLSWRRYRDRAWHAAIPWLTGLAAATNTVRLGTMVASPNFRHPVTLAKEAMTLDHISSGRLTLGIGAGGPGFDATVLGGAQPTPSQRASRLAEFVHVLDQILRQPATSYRGAHYTVNDARTIPGCLQQPRVPLAIAAGGRKTLALAARYADTWITYGDATHQDTSPSGTERIVRTQAEQLAEHCAAVGRDARDIARLYVIGNTDERPLASVEAFTDFIGRYHELGFTDVVFHHPRPDDPEWNDDPEIVEAIATDVLPTLGCTTPSVTKPIPPRRANPCGQAPNTLPLPTTAAALAAPAAGADNPKPDSRLAK